MSKATILIVDDEKNTAEGLQRYLSVHGYEAQYVCSPREALRVCDDFTPDVVLTDLRMGAEMSGMDLMVELKKRALSSTIIMMTAYGTVENAVAAMQAGAHHYLMKPINLEELLIVVRKAVSQRKLLNENKELKARLERLVHSDLILGKSELFRRVYDEAVQVANSTASVLIQGESGTGKELIAELIHKKSDRNDHAFVPVHCAALSEHLLESELFGHEKGAFTGAVEKKVGRFEKAHGGTIFLDEIAEIDHKTQVKLLRVLQEGRFERVGGTKTITADSRLIAATNKDLHSEVRKGHFREDLFYRIKVIVLQVPSLRERVEDIAEIFDHYIAKFSRDNHKRVPVVDRKVYDLLTAYSWPGNIRELKNVAERMIVLLRSDRLTVQDVPQDILVGVNGYTDGHGPEESATERHMSNATIADMERETIRKKLLALKGNKTRVAKALGISRRTLYRKIEEYGLQDF